MKLIPYLRVSTDKQASEGTGLDVQLDAIRRWAKAHGHRLTEPCLDEGVSGAKELENRPALIEAMLRLREPGIDGIVVYRLDRLARALVVQEQLLADIRARGGELYSTSETENGYLVDDGETEDPSRKMIRQILGAVSEYERSMIALRLRSARELKHRQGGYAGYGSPAFGQRSDGGVLVPDEGENAAIERMVELRKAGSSLREVADTLQAEGYKTKRGASWHPTTIARVLGRQGMPAGPSEFVESPATTRIRELRAEGRTIPQITDQLNAEGLVASRGGRWHPTAVSRVLRADR
jgi:DNA invertase Pin-like site-specific DNA recombinase